MGGLATVCVVAVLCCAVAATAAGADDSQSTSSGMVFGDFYWFAANHDDGLVDANGFWVRRLYLTESRSITSNLKLRLRLEMRSHGNPAAGSRELRPELKDLAFHWRRFADSMIYVGLVQTPTFTHVERAWGLRHVARSPVEMWSLEPTRDMGIGLRNDYARGFVDYNVMLGNGTGISSEDNPGKKYMFSLGLHLAHGLELRGHADYNDMEGDWWRTTEQALLLYRGEAVRAGAQYVFHERRLFRSDTARILSVFAVKSIGDGASVFVRADRSLDPNPDAEAIDYLPLAAGSKFWYLLAGYEISPAPGLKVSPNLQIVAYDASGIDADIVPHITLYYNWADDTEN